MNKKDLIEINRQNLDRVILWIQNADTKASIVLAFNGGLMVFLAGKVYDAKSLFQYAFCSGPLLLLLLCAIFFIAFFCFSIYFALRTLLPSTSPTAKNKLMFFGTIAGLSEEEFKKKALSLGEDEALENLVEQTYINSKIARDKFDNLKKSWKFLIGAGMLALLFVIGLLIVN